MSRTLLGAACALAMLAGCATGPLPESATPAYCPSPPALPVNAQGLILLPPVVAGPGPASDPDAFWANELETSLAEPWRLAGRGPETAQALARLEYLANGFQHNMRWQFLPFAAAPQLQSGSRAFRDSLGIARDAPDQDVVGALFATECLLRVGDRAGAERALARVAQAPDALDLIAPPGGNAAPRVPAATVAAASVAAKAIRNNGRTPLLFGARR
jgi:hypothetical protein